MVGSDGDGCVALESGNELRHPTRHGEADGSTTHKGRHDGDLVGGEQVALGNEASGKGDEEHGQIAYQQPGPLLNGAEGKDAASQRQKREQ
jgi:hypothetical protein